MVRDGYFYGLSLLVVAVLLQAVTHSWAWAIMPLALALFFLWFFRDPQRAIPQGEGLVVSPADGLVTSVDRFLTVEGERIRVSIFLNVFDVHVNRAPTGGVLREVRYQKGQFLNAMDVTSAEKNEQNIVTLASDDGYEVVFKQIAGLLARRIVFHFKAGDRVRRGQRVGLIKFGSRTDIELPGHAEVRVRKGERVKGGASVIAQLARREAPTEPAAELVGSLV
jgi:phosphatidylserine decarboxylase